MANGVVGPTTVSRLLVKTDNSTIKDILKTQGGPTAWYLRKLSELFARFSLGAYQSNIQATPSCIAATGTITLTALPAANDTVTIGDKTVTFVASGATGLQVNIGASVTITAASLVTLINTNSNFTGRVTATSALGVVTLTSVVPGNVGNCIILSKSSLNITVAAFSGGTEAATATWAHGL